MGPMQPIKKETAVRLLKYITPFWPRLLLVLVCILLNAFPTASAATFLGRIIDGYITPLLQEALSGADPNFSGLLSAILQMAGLYALAIIASFVQARVMAVVSQSVLRSIRDQMFTHMQTLPIRYFDTHTHGEVMSFYTNDTDALRQMISQMLPQTVSSIITLIVVFISMLQCSVWLTLIMLAGTVAMLKITMKMGTSSAKYFMKQQTSLASLNGYVEEMINGQKVVKVFNHEPMSREEFDRRNDELCVNMTEGNKVANMLGPVNNNLGHLLYVILAIIGGALAIGGVTNLSLSGSGVLTLGAITSFLTLSRNFMQPVSQLSQQISFIAMAMAGADRIFSLMDEPAEEDHGYVHLVRCREENGQIGRASCRERV